MTQIALGVDGGGTSTTCVLIDITQRRELARSSSLSSNWSGPFSLNGAPAGNSVGPAGALQALRSAVTDTLLAAPEGVDVAQLASVCLCMSGVDSEEDALKLKSQVASWFPAETAVRVSNDAAAALASGTSGSQCGCVLIAGTGTIAYARSADGHEARSSGWGPAFLDAGSGYDLGHRALAAVARAADGRSPPTALTQAIMQHCKVSMPEKLIEWAYADADWSRIAAIAPHVLHCAKEQQDPAALAILHAVIPEVVASLQAVVKRCSLPLRFPLVLTGGLLSSSNLYHELLTVALQDCFAEVQIIHPKVDAATGAALLAASLPRTGQTDRDSQSAAAQSLNGQ